MPHVASRRRALRLHARGPHSPVLSLSRSRLSHAPTPLPPCALASRSWTFATAADIEATWFLAGHPLHDLSEQQLVECDTRNYGCDGGWPFSAMQYVAHIGGLTTYEDYPYKGICAWDACEQPDVFYGTPRCDTEKLNEEIQGGNVAHIGGYQFVAMGAEYEDLMRVALAKNGPLALAFNANGMDFYVHGIAGCSEGMCDAGGVDHHTPCDPDALDHAVLLVGYGIQESKSLLSGGAAPSTSGRDDDGGRRSAEGDGRTGPQEPVGRRLGRGRLLPPLRGDNTRGIANMVVHSVVKDPRARAPSRRRAPTTAAQQHARRRPEHGAQP